MGKNNLLYPYTLLIQIFLKYTYYSSILIIISVTFFQILKLKILNVECSYSGCLKKKMID